MLMNTQVRNTHPLVLLSLYLCPHYDAMTLIKLQRVDKRLSSLSASSLSVFKGKWNWFSKSYHFLNASLFFVLISFFRGLGAEHKQYVSFTNIHLKSHWFCHNTIFKINRFFSGHWTLWTFTTGQNQNLLKASKGSA